MNLYVHDVDIEIINNEINDCQIWCVVSVDGSDTPVSTSSFSIEPHVSFNYELNLQFSVDDVTNCYMYLTLCYYGENNEMKSLSRAKARINKLPLNGPNAFRLPLHSVKKPHEQIASILLSGIIDPPMSNNQDPQNFFTSSSYDEYQEYLSD